MTETCAFWSVSQAFILPTRIVVGQ